MLLSTTSFLVLQELISNHQSVQTLIVSALELACVYFNTSNQSDP